MTQPQQPRLEPPKPCPLCGKAPVTLYSGKKATCSDPDCGMFPMGLWWLDTWNALPRRGESKEDAR